MTWNKFFDKLLRNSLKMKIDLHGFTDLVKDGYIKYQKHPKADLLIWNYTQKTQYDQMWVPETLLCRGIITDLDGNIIERPFQKFFNFEEHVDRMGELLPEGVPIVTEKLDGYLGILYKAPDGWAIATRDSFVSEQALKGTEILRKEYPFFNPDPSFTHLFEILCPGNRVIIDYHYEDLIFIGAIDRDSGFDISPMQHIQNIPMPKADSHIFPSMEEMLSEKNTKNREGFVLYYPEVNLRLKVKFDEYVKLYRSLSGISSRTVWEKLRDRKPIEELARDVPDEFYDWIHVTAEELRRKFSNLKRKIENISDMEEIKGFSRNEQCNYIMKYHKEYAHLILSLLDGNDYEAEIWKKIKPKNEQQET